MPAERARDFERELEVSVEAVARMRKRGIGVLPGGDYGFPATPHGTYARDLWIFVKILGFSAMDTLVAATRLGGALMGRPDELSVVQAGALSDLLLVDGDPLADIAILQDRGAFRMIMKDGLLHKTACSIKESSAVKGKGWPRYRAVSGVPGLRNTATISTPRNQPAKSRSTENRPVSAAEAARRAARLRPAIRSPRNPMRPSRSLSSRTVPRMARSSTCVVRARAGSASSRARATSDSREATISASGPPRAPISRSSTMTRLRIRTGSRRS